jgi:hypothetical protein
MDHGSVFKRCGCRDEGTERLLGAGCPKLGTARQGSWYFSADLPSATGERRRLPRRWRRWPARPRVRHEG